MVTCWSKETTGIWARFASLITPLSEVAELELTVSTEMPPWYHVPDIRDLLVGVRTGLLDDKLRGKPVSLVFRELLFGAGNHLVAPLGAEIAVRQADRRIAAGERGPYASRKSNRSARGYCERCRKLRRSMNLSPVNLL